MKNRCGFTVIELLMVISILGILSALALVALQGVRNDARVARTRSVISRVRDLLQEKLDAITARPMPFGFERDFRDAPPNGLLSSAAPNAIQRQHIFKRTICEWVRAEMPTEQEYLGTTLVDYPSLESQQPNLAVLPNQPAYWPNLATLNWVNIYRTLMLRQGNPARQQILAMKGSATDWLLDPFAARASGNYWCMENYNGWDGLAVPGVVNSLNANQLAHSVAEAGDMLYLILHNTYDRDGNRGTHFLQPEDLGDTNLNGIPELVDSRGFPLIFSITVKSTRDDGTIVTDVNLNGVVDFVDALLDPRFPREPQDYQIHLGSIATEEYPPHLQHLRHADFSALNL